MGLRVAVLRSSESSAKSVCRVLRRENVMAGTLKALAPWPGLAEQMQQRYVGKLEELRDAGIRTKLQVRPLQKKKATQTEPIHEPAEPD